MFGTTFILFLIKAGLLFTSGIVTLRAISSLYNPPLKLTPVLETYEGLLQGKIGYSRNNTEYWQFLGIPYALPPIRSLRFQAPIPMKRWYDVKQAIKYPPACLQYEHLILMKASGQEDCLYLNVFTSPAPSPPKPVIVYIYGGGFFAGESNTYRPDYFMDYPVVLVTFNYRLGAFGFLNFQEKNDTLQRFPRGNMGLKDQNVVLQWVRRNIGYFNGDPERVTLMGQSAGGAAVHYHMLAEASKGLFQRAVIMSGSALAPTSYSEKPKTIALDFTKRLNCPTNSSLEMFSCLMNYDGNKLVQNHQFEWADPFYSKDLFLPSIEPLKVEDTFITESPEILIRSDKGTSKVPLMIGVTSAEGTVRSMRFENRPDLIAKLEKNWNHLIGKVLFQDEPLLKPRVAEELRITYFGKSRQNKTEDFMHGITRLSSDVLFNRPVHNTAMEHSFKAPVFMYYFDYRSAMLPGGYSFYRASVKNRGQPEANLLRTIFKDWVGDHFLGQQNTYKYGVSHGEDVYQLWNVNGLSRWVSSEDTKFSRSFVQSIVDFSYGKKELMFKGSPWPPVTSGLTRKSPDMLIPFMVMDNSPPRLSEEPFFYQRVERLNKLVSLYN